MQRSAEQIVLICDKRREKLFFLGSEEEWCSRRAVFQCECGQDSPSTAEPKKFLQPRSQNVTPNPDVRFPFTRGREAC